MLKSPEEYFSELDFNIGSENVSGKSLNAGERSFIQKYLGEDALTRLQAVDPEPHLKPFAPKPAPRPAFAEPKIEVVQKKIEVAPSPPVVSPEISPSQIASAVSEKTKNEASQDLKVASPAAPTALLEREKTRVEVDVHDKAEEKEKTVVKSDVEVAASEKVETKVDEKVETVAPEKAATRSEIEAKIIDKSIVQTKVEAPAEIATVTETVAASPTMTAVEEISASERVAALKDRLKLEDEIQMVSFYVSGQLFLLPVAAIQEVLRYMELVKVPRAPDFVAGVINLRGRVTPVVHLAAILTDTPNPEYTEKNFVIICGSDNLQLGLIIDKISSMHMLPQNKIIWNAESKLGDSAEFLLAIANLDDKVCGIVAPEIITQKILAQE